MTTEKLFVTPRGERSPTVTLSTHTGDPGGDMSMGTPHPDSRRARGKGVITQPTLRTKTNPASITDRVRRFVRTPKGTLLLVFAVLLAVAGTATGWPVVLPHVLAAVAGACLAEVALVSLITRRLAWPSSALLSGLIVA